MNLFKETDTLISIVTVSYNAVLTIEQTILSVINQTYPNVEYIIIDGGSTDGTVDIIKKYADKIAYWVSEPDKGIYDAMNKGGLKTTGDFIQFLNAGDWFENEYVIEKIFKDNNYDNKSMLIKVTDKELLEKTGGIIQRNEWLSYYSKWKICRCYNSCIRSLI